MPNAWIDALKEWNKGKDMWCLPKKGGKDHAEVVAIMNRKKGKTPEPKKAKAKEPKAKEPKIDVEGQMESNRNYEKLMEYLNRKEKKPEPSVGEERMKMVSEHLKKKDAELEAKKRKKDRARATAIIAQRLKEKRARGEL